MAKNNMDILLGNILGSAAISPDHKTVEQTTEAKPIPKQEKRSIKPERKEQMDSSWRHFSFICSRELVDNVQAIALQGRIHHTCFYGVCDETGHRGIRGEAWQGSEGQVKKNQWCNGKRVYM